MLLHRIALHLLQKLYPYHKTLKWIWMTVMYDWFSVEQSFSLLLCEEHFPTPNAYQSLVTKYTSLPLRQDWATNPCDSSILWEILPHQSTDMILSYFLDSGPLEWKWRMYIHRKAAAITVVTTPSKTLFIVCATFCVGEQDGGADKMSTCW